MKKRRKLILAAAGVLASAAFYVCSGVNAKAESAERKGVPEELILSAAEEETFSESQKEEIRGIVTECLTSGMGADVASAVREVLSAEVERMAESGILSEGIRKCAEKEAGLINVNTAGKEELKTLPGIGDVKAENILRFREENGMFSSVEELILVDGISASVLEKIRSYITV